MLPFPFARLVGVAYRPRQVRGLRGLLLGEREEVVLAQLRVAAQRVAQPARAAAQREGLRREQRDPILFLWLLVMKLIMLT